MKLDFSQLNKQTKKSFSDQHAVIKKVMQGKIVALRTMPTTFGSYYAGTE
ncbi:hypothetical protein [Photobacterium kishitanii]|nr:hypothetical protein [Photobacterium kishitanii]